MRAFSIDRAGSRKAALLRAALLAALLAIVAYVALSTLYWQVRSTFAVPYWDQWGVIPAYTSFANNRVSLRYLMSQSNEHRIFFPRLIMFADLGLFGGRNAFNVAMSDIFQVAHLMLIGWMARRIWVRPVVGWLAAAFTATAMLSATQYENIYWGFQSQFVGVYLFAATGIASAVAYHPSASRVRRALALSGCLASGVVASFSMANGLAVWPLLVVLLAFKRAGRAAAVTATVAAATVLLYAYGYHPVSGHTPITTILHKPGDAAAYFLTYLGALVAPSSIPLAAAAGAGLLLLLSGLAIRAFVRHEWPDGTALFAWSNALFVLVSALITTLGRFGFGSIQALSSRYITPGTVLWSAAAVLTLQALPRGDTGRAATLARRVVPVTLAVLTLSIGVLNQHSAFDFFVDHEQKMAAASDALVAGVTDPATLSVLAPDTAQILGSSALLRAQGLSLFGNREANWMGKALEPLFAVDPHAQCKGYADVVRDLRPGGGSGAAAAGWAWNMAEHKAPRDILLVDGRGIIVGFGRGRLYRPDVQAALPAVESTDVGWRGFVGPNHAGPITAYALQSAVPSVCRLG